MKIGRWIRTGIFLFIVGVGITAVASTKVDFDQEIKRTFMDPTLEEKHMQFDVINTIHYNGSADSLKICLTDKENSFQYYEGKYISYNIDYNEDERSLSISETYKSHIGFSWKETNVLYISSPLDQINIKMQAGNVCIENLSMQKLNADVNCGNLVIKDTLSVKATLSSNAGNLHIRNSSFEDLSMRVNAGNLTFLGDIKLLGKIKVDVGNMSLQLKQSKEFYTINGQGEGNSRIEYAVSLGNSDITYEKE